MKYSKPELQAAEAVLDAIRGGKGDWDPPDSTDMLTDLAAYEVDE